LATPSFDDLATAFRHGNFRPLYFLYGEEPFPMDELQEILIQHALQPHERDFNLEILYGHETGVADLMARCAAYPMMAERRVVIVRGFEQVADNAAFQAYAARPNPTAVVMLLCNGKPNLTFHPYRALKQHAVAAEFKPLYDRQMPGWVADRFRAKGHRATGGAAQILADRLGPGLRAAANEIDKLITFVGEAKEVKEEDVLRAAGASHHASPFELQNALGRGDDATALAIARTIMAQASNRQGEAIAVVAILASFLTKLWRLTGCRETGVPEREWPGQIGVNPYFIRDYISALRHFPPARLGAAFGALLAADAELKGATERDPTTILTLALRQIARSRASSTRRGASVA
jgi:DNA polymerase-3 subunit delta